MANSMTSLTEKIVKKIQDTPPCNVPSTNWVVFTYLETPTDTAIYSTIGGNLWVCYEWWGSDYAPTLILIYEDGNGDWQSQTLETGQTIIQLPNQFFLYYDVGSTGDSVKLGYQLS